MKLKKDGLGWLTPRFLMTRSFIREAIKEGHSVDDEEVPSLETWKTSLVKPGSDIANPWTTPPLGSKSFFLPEKQSLISVMSAC